MSFPPDEQDFFAAAAALAAGEVVGLPTDTVYGLGVLPTSPAAVRALFELKGRPESVAIAVLVSDLDQALELVGDGSDRVEKLCRAFWPGPLTVVARRAASAFVLGGDEATVGLRCPDDDFVRSLAARLGPLAVTSANRHGQPPITTAVALRSAFPSILVVDGGPREAMPSTVVTLLGEAPEVLREGTIRRELISEVLGGDEGIAAD